MKEETYQALGNKQHEQLKMEYLAKETLIFTNYTHKNFNFTCLMPVAVTMTGYEALVLEFYTFRSPPA